jgi:hypothetical protein
MMYLPGFIIGTLLLLAASLALLRRVARTQINLTSTMPLFLRAVLAACLTSWVFLVLETVIAPFPSLYIISILKDEIMYRPQVIFDTRLVFYYSIFDFLLKFFMFIVFTLRKQNSLPHIPDLKTAKVSATWYGIFIVAIAGSWLLVSLATPCRFKINGVCYDRPKASNPPISARFEAIDADTGKPLPGVLISFFWKTYLGNGRPDQCARNVIGETDAQGKFSNTAKNGSWMYSSIEMFKAGWERVYFRRLLDQTYISHEYRFSMEEIGIYPAWEKQLESMGYVLDTTSTTNAYRKNFELGNQYNRIMTAEWEPQGLRTYWVKMRGFPRALTPNQIGSQCYNRQLEKIDPDAEFIGANVPRFSDKRLQLERSKHALQAICDDKWDSVPSDLPKITGTYWLTTPTGRLLGDAGSVFAENDPQLKILLPDFYGEHSSADSLRDPNHTRRLTHEERLLYCAAAHKSLENSNE